MLSERDCQVFIVYPGREGLSASGQFLGLPEAIWSCLPSCLRSLLQDGMFQSPGKLIQVVMPDREKDEANVFFDKLVLFRICRLQKCITGMMGPEHLSNEDTAEVLWGPGIRSPKISIFFPNRFTDYY
ncbi:hypothetical protein LEMLEM_LOCUS11241 [Lemmus lemmus]